MSAAIGGRMPGCRSLGAVRPAGCEAAVHSAHHQQAVRHLVACMPAVPSGIAW